MSFDHAVELLMGEPDGVGNLEAFTLRHEFAHSILTERFHEAGELGISSAEGHGVRKVLRVAPDRPVEHGREASKRSIWTSTWP